MSPTEHIAVIGAGPMGNGIAQVFATKGYDVIFYDPDPQYLNGAIRKIRANFRFLAENDFVQVDDIDPSIERIRLAQSLKEAITGARFVVEAVAHKLRLSPPSANIEFRRSLYKEMAQYCSPITILASCETFQSITDIARDNSVSERIVGTHFCHPAYLAPLVEVVGGKDTLQEVTDYVCSLLRAVGKHPVVVNRDIPGLVGHRVQEALRRECQAVVEEGIASPQAVDEIIKKGFGIWLSTIGPLENADVFGLDLTNKNREIPHRYIKRPLDIYRLFHVKPDNAGAELGTGKQTGCQDLDEALIEKRWDDFFDQLIHWNQKHGQGY
jgi:3-hydroxybutyryl-CoA dehydrogenase